MIEPDWNAIRCFVAVCRTGSLTEAAATLNLSIATVGRRIDSLETALGVKLLMRGPTGAKPTEAGRAILIYAEPGARQLTQIARAARALAVGPQDTPIRISSTEPMIADVLAPNIPALLAAHPGLRLEFDVSNALSNLNSGEADIAIRLADPQSDNLIARRLPAIELGLFCSGSYLAGRDAEALDLSSERLLWLDPRYGRIPENVWIMDHGLEHAAVVRSSSVRALQHAAEAGAGIAPLPAFSASTRGLVRIHAPGLPKRQPWLVFHRDTRRNPRMKAARDWINQSCEAAFGSAQGKR